MAYMLTEQGIAAAETIQEPRGKDMEILAFMYSVGKKSSVELEEIQSRARMSTEQTIRTMTRLENTGYVEEV